MTKPLRAYLLALAAFFLSATPMLAQAQAPVAAAPAGDSAPGPDAASGPAGYRLGNADRVRVTVYNEPDLSGEFTVGSNGVLSLPLIGEVPVLGQTSSEAASKIETKLRDGYLKDPHVALEVLSFRPFYILGEVTKPGEYPYSEGLTVQKAVATAEGFTYRANQRKVYIKRAGSDVEKAEPLTPSLAVGPGDQIRVVERYF
ncbi:polysaccharide biosynthesis/export family protein [Sphingomonas morindae]|uniref:Polysaccharide export protein n=1 Tax=Sphingomonas morindae TaxID=1541170 RepID=A0ABY4X6E7_9SPHN|nr:polysaccharide biosynthesis/export family protein [Sphingomonas morindae]USI72477.1 polysaccharide export protein [Sphingomonas morindae]